MSKINSIVDHFEGRGTVKKVLIDNRTGEVVKEFADHNLIVKTGRSALIRMLAGELTDHITKMGIGRGGTADLGENAFNPIAPADGDTALTTKVSDVAIATTTVDLSNTNPRVTFVALFDCSVVNSLVNECGLFFTDGTTMFARHTFDTVSLKASSNFSLQISWTIEF